MLLAPRCPSCREERLEMVLLQGLFPCWPRVWPVLCHTEPLVTSDFDVCGGFVLGGALGPSVLSQEGGRGRGGGGGGLAGGGRREAPAETHVLFLGRHSAVPPALSLDRLGMKLGLGSGPQNTCREVDQPPGHGPGCG